MSFCLRTFNALGAIGLAFGQSTWLGPAQFAHAQAIPLSLVVPNTFVEGTIEVLEPPMIDGTRLVIQAWIEAPSLFASLDALTVGRGNLGSCTRRLYWVGPTRLSRSPTDGVLAVTSRARYELWICESWLTTLLSRDTKTIDMLAWPSWNAEDRSLALTYRIDNIRNFPNDLENLLQRLGVEFSGRNRVYVSNSADFEQLGLNLRAWQLHDLNEGRGIAISLTIDMDAGAATALALRHIGSADLVPEMGEAMLGLLNWRY